MAANADQVAFWNGEAGERWVQAQERMDVTLEPVGRAAMDAARLRPGARVLDVGCGCGATTLDLASRVGPGGRVVGVDISGPMLARARCRAGDLPVEFVQADAAFAPLPEVELVFSRFGVMFFEEPVAAFTHLRAATAPGGQVAFVCWRALAENPWAKLPLAALDEVLGPAPNPPAPDAPGPFAFAKRERIERILDGAGWSAVAVRPLDVDLIWTEATDDDSLREMFVQIGPAARRLADTPEDLRERAVDAILARVRPHVGAGGLVLPAAVWVVTADR